MDFKGVFIDILNANYWAGIFSDGFFAGFVHYFCITFCTGFLSCVLLVVLGCWKDVINNSQVFWGIWAVTVTVMLASGVIVL